MGSDLIDLAKYGPTGVAVGALILVYLMFTKFLKFSQSNMDRAQRCREDEAKQRKMDAQKMEYSHSMLAQAIDKNTIIADENIKFLRNLNGRLATIVSEKIEKEKSGTI